LYSNSTNSDSFKFNNLTWNDSSAPTEIKISNNVLVGNVEEVLTLIQNNMLINSIIVLTSLKDPSNTKSFRVNGQISSTSAEFIVPVEQLSTLTSPTNPPVPADYFYIDIFVAGPSNDIILKYSADTTTSTGTTSQYFETNSSWTGNATQLAISKTAVLGNVDAILSTVKDRNLTNTVIEFRYSNNQQIFRAFRVNSFASDANNSFVINVTQLTGNPTVPGFTVGNNDFFYVRIIIGASGSSGSSGISGSSGTSGTGFQTVEGGEVSNRVLLSTGNVNTAKTSIHMNVGTSDPNAPLDNLRTRLEFSGSIRANAFTGSLDGFATSGSIVQVYSSAGTYTPPNWAKRITVIAVGAGGGGGGGCSNSSFNTAFWRTGGGGGAGGSVVVGSFEVSDMITGLSTTTQRTWTITVSDGGNGGSAGVGQSNGQPGVAGGWASFYNTNRPTATVAAPGGLGGAGGIQTSSGTYQPYVSGGAVRNVDSPNFYAGGPGGQGVATRNYGSSGTADDRLAVNPSGIGTINTNWNAAALPFSGSLPHNGTLQLPSAIAPTGGGGGGGYARAGSTSTDTGTLGQWGGGGGAILQQNPLNPSANQPVVPGVIRPSTTSTSLTGIFNNWSQGNSGGTVGINTTNNQSIFWQNMRFGLGGVGGVPGFFAQVGSQPGGGGGGGAGGQGTGQNGARGGAGMVIVITEH
jgi:hypothetical protein